MTRTTSLAEISFFLDIYSLRFVTICRFPLEINWITLKIFVTYSR